MAAFILQLFHKFEVKTAEGTWNIPCKWSKYEGNETQRMEMHSSSIQAASQLHRDQSQQLLSQVIYSYSTYTSIILSDMQYTYAYK